ncbi:MAG: SDR family oxidoreductase [Bacteroidaceae bacterium]|nr:SDR family oxidoreductase [Bacteroidaceae bacterium]
MSYNPYSLEGKTILVTGASSGIGKATAIECSKMGATLIICGRNEARTQETLQALEGEEHTFFIGDLTDDDKVNELVCTIGKLDGVVLCAGVGNKQPFQFCTREKFDAVFNTNFFAPVELLRLLIKKKKINKFGSVVFVSSIGGVFTHFMGNAVYDSTKSAIDSTMKTCAIELAAKQIRVNSVNPGMTKTPLIVADSLTQDQLDEDAKLYPLGRYGEPQEIALGIIYLLSNASAWVTGHALTIDGGCSIKA